MRPNKAFTLIELLFSVLLIWLVVLALYSIESFSRNRIIITTRQSVVQNELLIALEDISKSVVRSVGTPANPGISNLTAGIAVRVDDNGTPTPSNLADDTYYNYTLSANKIYKNGSSLSNRAVIVTFNRTIVDNGTGVDLYLLGRYDPAQASAFDNPEVEVKTKAYSRSIGRAY